MLAIIGNMIVEPIASLLGVACLLRCYMNWLGMPARNPLSHFVIALTDWAVRPMRRVLPAAGRFDASSLVCAYLVALATLLLLFLFHGGLTAISWIDVVVASVVLLIRWALYLVLGLTILFALLSWINPYAPIAPAVALLVRPFLAPFQRVIPPVGGFDLSPLALLIVVNLLLYLVTAHLWRLA